MTDPTSPLSRLREGIAGLATGMVRPLRWEPDGPDDWMAADAYGEPYRIERMAEGGGWWREGQWMLTHTALIEDVPFDTVDKAKAAAQADYAARGLACLADDIHARLAALEGAVEQVRDEALAEAEAAVAAIMAESQAKLGQRPGDREEAIWLDGVEDARDAIAALRRASPGTEEGA